MAPEPRHVSTALIGWYRRSRRDLPWRRADAGPWAVLVSEIMLQQTPVNRVLPAYAAWTARWPSPAALAADSPGEAVRMWGKLGYPRRALRLHACAVEIVARFSGDVPDDVAALESLPGIGSYTARAVAVFAFGQRQPVVDTNVRRVVARVFAGLGETGPPSTRRDLAAVQALLPRGRAAAAELSIALMEFGALVCTARSPRCADCPIAAQCAWRVAGYPAYQGPRATPQPFTGTDRQLRGRILDVLRANPDPVTAADLDVDWPDPAQRARALASLLADGLVIAHADGSYGLPA